MDEQKWTVLIEKEKLSTNYIERINADIKKF
jgi:hypothetical protein